MWQNSSELGELFCICWFDVTQGKYAVCAYCEKKRNLEICRTSKRNRNTSLGHYAKVFHRLGSALGHSDPISTKLSGLLRVPTTKQDGREQTLHSSGIISRYRSGRSKRTQETLFNPSPFPLPEYLLSWLQFRLGKDVQSL